MWLTMLPALSHTPVLVKIPESYTLNSTWNRMRPISCFKDVSKYFFQLCGVDQSLLSKMHLPAVSQRHRGWDLRRKPDSLSSLLIHFTAQMRVFFQHFYGPESIKPCQNITIWKSHFPWPRLWVRPYTWVKRQQTQGDTGNTGRITGIPDWVFQSNVSHMPFWLYSA